MTQFTDRKESDGNAAPTDQAKNHPKDVCMALDPLGLIGLIIVIVIHTGALFHWGGRTSRSIEQLTTIADRQQAQLEKQDERIRRLELANPRVALGMPPGQGAPT